jgi:hypothetical protein
MWLASITELLSKLVPTDCADTKVAADAVSVRSTVSEAEEMAIAATEVSRNTAAATT